MENNVLEKVETKITDIVEKDGIRKDNIDYLFKLVDIHKDLKNENYWKTKEEYFNEIRKL